MRAAILAGGRALRLGGEKATAELAGRPLIGYGIEAARAAGLEPVVVAKRASPLPTIACEVIVEPDRPVHPLMGIITALESSVEPTVVLACDMPLLTAPLLRWLAGRRPPAVASVDGRLEPLLAIYRPGDAAVLRSALREEAPLRTAVERLRPRLLREAQLRRFGEPRDLVLGVNTKSELLEAARLISA